MVVFSKKNVKTGAERARTFRTRLKVDVERYKAYKNKDKERKRVQRKGQALSPSEVARRKKLTRERVRKCRQRQKEKKAKNSSQDQDVSQAYQTPQALGKALGKVSSRVLPQSPRKRKAVVFKLAHASGFLRKKKCTRSNRGLPKETVNLVKVFFQLDSISRQAVGRKDFVTVPGKQHKTSYPEKALVVVPKGML